MIEIKNITKSYKNNVVLQNFSLSVKKGEKIAILGKSGAGKSTILKLICGILKPDSGEINIACKNIGYVFQEHRLLPWLSAIENVKLPLLAKNYKNQQATKNAIKYLKAMHLEDFAHHFPSQLSGGMLQRVSIARAFACKPEIILLDEPFSALDYELKYELLNLTKSWIQKSNIPLVYVTHIKEEARFIADRIIKI